MRRELIDRIEELGVLVMVSGIVGSNTRRRLDPREFRGFALVDSMAPLIFVNGRDTQAAQVFTLVHELAHLCLGGSALSDPSDVVRPGVSEERWCNAVAAAALVPEAVLRADYRGDGGNYYNTVPLRLGRRFAQAVLLSTFGGRTPYGEAYELLQVRKHATFKELAAGMEVA